MAKAKSSSGSRTRKLPPPRFKVADGLDHLIELVIGDWSRDGHEKVSEILVRSNLDKAGMSAAYKAGVKVIGVDVSRNIADSYEHRTLPEGAWDKYVAAGIAEFGWETEGEFDGWLYVDEFLDLYLFTVLKGCPEFRFERLDDNAETINIGGYGLFT